MRKFKKYFLVKYLCRTNEPLKAQKRGQIFTLEIKRIGAINAILLGDAYA